MPIQISDMAAVIIGVVAGILASIPASIAILVGVASYKAHLRRQQDGN